MADKERVDHHARLRYIEVMEMWGAAQDQREAHNEGDRNPVIRPMVMDDSSLASGRYTDPRSQVWVGVDSRYDANGGEPSMHCDYAASTYNTVGTGCPTSSRYAPIQCPDGLGVHALAPGTHPISRKVDRMTTCVYCGRAIVDSGEDSLYRWIDPEATGDDSIWRETCDSHDTFTAEHEPDQ